MAKLDTSKETKNDDQKGETSWKHPAKPAEDSETKIPVGYSVGQNKEPNPSATWNDLVQKTNLTTKRTFRLKKDFLTKVILLSLAIGRCVTAKNIEGLSVENKIIQAGAELGQAQP